MTDGLGWAQGRQRRSEWEKLHKKCLGGGKGSMAAQG